MNHQFQFSKSMYIRHSWHKYVISWLSVSVVLSTMMYFNGMLSIASGFIAMVIILFFAILIMLNRVRTWKKSKVELNENSIKLILVKADGYEANIELGRKKKIVTYNAIPIKEVRVSGNCVHIYGDIIVSEQTYVNSMTYSKEKQIDEFKIPPYFTDWQILIKHLKNI